MGLLDALNPVFADAAGLAPLPERTDRDGEPISNLLLLSIPDEEFVLLRPLLEPVDLPRYRVLYEQGEKIVHSYFLNQGMISLVIIASDGRTVEVGIAGRRGVVGVPLAFGLNDAYSRAIVQLPGNGVRISAEFLPEAFDRCPNLRRLIERYVLTQQLQVAQIAACNRLHDMDQRLARWLLMCQDTIDSGMIPLTHEFIAQMLGSGRPTVTIAAGVLERAGLIENTRGNVKILNRKRLEDAACECYGAIQNFHTALALQ
jgi:CRP-like cAMP-binding protein